MKTDTQTQAPDVHIHKWETYHTVGHSSGDGSGSLISGAEYCRCGLIRDWSQSAQDCIVREAIRKYERAIVWDRRDVAAGIVSADEIGQCGGTYGVPYA